MTTTPKLLATWNPTRGIWETPHGQIDLFSEHSEPYSETWPTSGISRRGTAFQLPPSARPTVESAYSSQPSLDESFLPTPTANLGTNGGAQLPDKRRAGGHSVSIQDAAMEIDLLGTPRANINGPSANRVGNDRGRLEQQISDLLPTPTVGNIDGGNKTRSGDRSDELLLPGVVETFLPTPRASRGASSTEIAYGLGGERTDDGRPQGEVVFGPTCKTCGHAEDIHSAGGFCARCTNPPNACEDDELGRPGWNAEEAEEARLLPTPTTRDADGSGGSTPWNVTLTDAVVRTDLGAVENPRHMLPTPRESDGPKGAASAHARSAERLEEGRATLPEAVALLPTPAAQNHNDGEDAQQWLERYEKHASKEEGATRAGMPLPVAVQLLPTPLVSDANSPMRDEVAGRDSPQLRAVRQILPAEGDQDITADGTLVAWGKYRAAIKRAEAVSGRLAPSPTRNDGRDGRARLSSRFVEWMMLLDDGHVTGRGLTRAQELARLGNGVVPIQAAVSTCNGIQRLAAMKRGQL